MTAVFVVTRVDYDSMENRDPSYRTVVGFTESEDAATAWLATQKHGTVKGWDGVWYPYFTVQSVPPLPDVRS